MNLTAAVIVRNERQRYLEPFLLHLLEFCDHIAILDDGSTDGWFEALRGVFGKEGDRIRVLRHTVDGRNEEPAFYRHAEARNRLLEFALDGWPHAVLSIDADEFVSDGATLRAAVEAGKHDAWNLCLQEVWGADARKLRIRQDGGWEEHDVPMVWIPDRGRPLRIKDRGHATGRVPDIVHRQRIGHTGTSLLHLGWARQSEREERYARYRDGDGGKFHASAHIRSIAWEEERMTFDEVGWPAGLKGYKTELLRRVRA